jgi:hypothetical protein
MNGILYPDRMVVDLHMVTDSHQAQPQDPAGALLLSNCARDTLRPHTEARCAAAPKPY